MNYSRRNFLKQIYLSSLGFSLLGCSQSKAERKPNIVFIMIDDLGYGDVGCYGSKLNRTPNIDKLASQGIRFTDFHANGPMCSPTRASLMTGMYQHRFGEKFEHAISGKRHYDQGLPLEAFTVAEALKQGGYTTGMFGKWHLGYQPPFLPPDQGFDEFIGLAAGDGDHHTHVDRWGREDWWHNNKKKMETGYTADLLTSHSIDFIEKNKNRPFFLYLSHLSIHFPWQGPDDPPHRRPGTTYENDKWGIIPDRNNVSPHVKAMVESIDKGVGKIVEALEKFNLRENTLLIFTSDNGGYIHYADSHFNISSNGPLRGQKTEVYEGGHRVPFIASWPGKIPAGKTSGELIMTMDMFPTFAELAKIRVPDNIQFDGRSILPHLLKGKSLPERTVFWKIDRERAIRKGKWKLCLIGDSSPELFDLSEDIGESNNLAQQHPALVKQLSEEYRKWEEEITASY